MELYLKPDMTTYQILPWDSGQENVAGVICDVMDPDGNPSWADTRGLLKETVSRLEKLGLQIYFDFQCEFYLFHSDDEEGRQRLRMRWPDITMQAPLILRRAFAAISC